MNHGRSAENPGLTLQYKPLGSFTELKLWLKQKSRSFDSGSTNLKLWDKPAACAVQPMTGLVWAQLWLADLFLTLRAARSADFREPADHVIKDRAETMAAGSAWSGGLYVVLVLWIVTVTCSAEPGRRQVSSQVKPEPAPNRLRAWGPEGEAGSDGGLFGSCSAQLRAIDPGLRLYRVID